MTGLQLSSIVISTTGVILLAGYGTYRFGRCLLDVARGRGEVAEAPPVAVTVPPCNGGVHDDLPTDVERDAAFRAIMARIGADQ